MISIHTCRFGLLEVDESAILEFPSGVPGFEWSRRFAVVRPPELAPIVCLQSLDSADFCLWAAPVAAIDEFYSLELSAEDSRALDLEKAPRPETLCLAILCAPENGLLTANLLAPVVVNLERRLAVQAVRTDSRYSHRHAIAGEALCS
ncbi:MAG TPA: flagellar assembly protein FliW [Bryobacteraceae bacterium]|jgi:flagellar assembly factor FliW